MQNLISHFLLEITVCLRVSASEMYQLFLHSSLTTRGSWKRIFWLFFSHQALAAIHFVSLVCEHFYALVLIRRHKNAPYISDNDSFIFHCLLYREHITVIQYPKQCFLAKFIPDYAFRIPNETITYCWNSWGLPWWWRCRGGGFPWDRRRWCG